MRLACMNDATSFETYMEGSSMIVDGNSQGCQVNPDDMFTNAYDMSGADGSSLGLLDVLADCTTDW